MAPSGMERSLRHPRSATRCRHERSDSCSQYHLHWVDIYLKSQSAVICSKLPLISLQISSIASCTTLAALSASIALVAVIFPAVINNNKSPYVDTLRTWTCGWDSMDIGSNDGPSSGFATMCNESVWCFICSSRYALMRTAIRILCHYTSVRPSTMPFGYQHLHSSEQQATESSIWSEWRERSLARLLPASDIMGHAPRQYEDTYCRGCAANCCLAWLLLVGRDTCNVLRLVAARQSRITLIRVVILTSVWSLWTMHDLVAS